jgi:integrase
MSTINEEYEHWFKNKEYMVRDSTLAAYDLMYRNHIKNDEIANMEIKNIRSRHLQDMIGRLHQTGLSTKSIKDIIVLVKMIMGWFLDGLDLYLPKFNLQYPREEGAMKELETYSPEELRRLAGYIMEHPSYEGIAILITMMTGLRIGEVCGLKWRNVDPKEKNDHCRLHNCKSVYSKDIRQHGRKKVIRSGRDTKDQIQQPMHTHYDTARKVSRESKGNNA